MNGPEEPKIQEEIHTPEASNQQIANHTPDASDTQENNTKKEASTPTTDLYTICKMLVTAICALVLIFTFVGRLIIVNGASMESTLHHGEMLLVRCLAYTPQQGDIVILSKEGFHNGDAIVKRVIATGGQTLEIDYNSSTVYVDGVALEEPYIKEFMQQQSYQKLTSVTIPEGCVFVMGDNRNNSDDSRDPALGIVDERLVVGEAVAIILPFSRIRLL